MTDAPERIWVHYAPGISEDEMGATIVGWGEKQASSAAEYIRADLYEELKTKLEVATEALKDITVDPTWSLVERYGY